MPPCLNRGILWGTELSGLHNGPIQLYFPHPTQYWNKIQKAFSLGSSVLIFLGSISFHSELLNKAQGPNVILSLSSLQQCDVMVYLFIYFVLFIYRPIAEVPWAVYKS